MTTRYFLGIRESSTDDPGRADRASETAWYTASDPYDTAITRNGVTFTVPNTGAGASLDYFNPYNLGSDDPRVRRSLRATSDVPRRFVVPLEGGAGTHNITALAENRDYNNTRVEIRDGPGGTLLKTWDLITTDNFSQGTGGTLLRSTPGSGATGAKEVVTVSDDVATGMTVTPLVFTASTMEVRIYSTTDGQLARFLGVFWERAGGSVTPTVTSVTASPNPATVATGGSGQITVTVTGTNSPAQTVTASSTNTGVATSNNAGVVSGIAAGTATIRYTSTVDGTKYVDVPVTVTAVAPPPKAAIGLSTSVLAFASAVGGAAPLPQTFAVMNTGPNGTTLNASVAAQGASGGNAPVWLAAVLNAGVVTVTVTSSSLAVGNYTARVRVTDSAASNSPQDVYVTLAVTDATPAPAPITPDYPVSGVAEVLVLKPSWPVTFTVADPTKATISPTTATSGTLGVETPQPGGGTALMYRATTTVSAVAPGKLGLTATASGYEPVGIALDIRAAKTA